MADPIIQNRFDMVPDQDNTLSIGHSDLRFKDVRATKIYTDDAPVVSSLTQGSVPFTGDGGEIIDDNSNLAWDNDNKQLQVGEELDTKGFPSLPQIIGGDNSAYIGLQIKNHNTGGSTDFIASADDDGTGLTGHYVDVGIAGSEYDGSSTGNILEVTISNGGSGYVEGDVLTVMAGDYNAILTVTAVTDGVIDTVEITFNGSGYSIANDVLTDTNSVGSGCLVNIVSLLDDSLTQAHDTYLIGVGGGMIIGTDVAPDKYIIFTTNGTGTSSERMRINDNGIGIGITDPTARLHLPASTDTQPALKIEPGVLLSAAESGSIETDGTHIYWTDDNGVRRQLDQQIDNLTIDPTESPDGEITIFTFTEKPTFIISDGAKLRENKGWTWDTENLQAILTVPPQFDIWGEF